MAHAIDLDPSQQRRDLLVSDPDPGRYGADAHWSLVDKNGEVLAECSLWWRRTPSLPGHRVGLIGHYAARHAPAAQRLLEHACRELAGGGSTLAVAPVDGSTWRRYRLIVERGNEPVFFLEPDNPDDWPAHFLAIGFTPLAQYLSTVTTDLGRSDPRTAELGGRLAAEGIRIRAFDPARPEEELRRIYGVSSAAFLGNLLYTPIAEAEFLAQYKPLLPCVRPELVLIAEARGRAIGFLFAIPDRLQKSRGLLVDTVIIKSLAVLPESAGGGLGSLLIARCHEVSRELGYARVIHALMHEANASARISRHSTRPIRRYAVFARTLAP